MTATMLDRVAVEALLPPEDAPGLRLDRDRLGVGRLGTRALTEPQWTTVMPEARDAHIVRGGSRDGVTVAAEVGTLTVTGLDSEVLQRVRPSTPVRVRRLRDPHGGYGQLPYGSGPYGGDPSAADYLFTGRALDLHTAWQRSADDLATITAVTTLTAVDAVHQLANTQRYGAVITYEHEWQNTETLGQRTERLLGPTGLNWQGPVTRSPDWSNETVWTVTNGTLVQEPADPDGPGWSGLRHAAGVPYTEGRLSATLPTEGPQVTVAVWVRRLNESSSGSITVNLRDGNTLLASQDLSLHGTTWTLVSLKTPAPGTAVTLELVSRAPGSPSSSQVRGFVVTGLIWDTAGRCIGAGYPLGSIVYESTLANHVDLAVNSTRGSWWVDSRGVVQVRACRHGDGITPLLLSDEPGAPYSYVQLNHALDTSRVVNDLTLVNHGRKEDPEDPGSYVADDRRLGPFRDYTSTATNGNRAGEVDTGLAYPENTAPMFAGAPENLARAYLANTAAADAWPSRVRLYRDPSDPPLPPLDVMSPVDVRFRGQTYPCLVAGLEHEITPRRWHTTLTLVER